MNTCKTVYGTLVIQNKMKHYFSMQNMHYYNAKQKLYLSSYTYDNYNNNCSVYTIQCNILKALNILKSN